jgi:phenylalanyl-tRNA synthetase beta chain
MIDEETRTLTPEMLVIADAGRPVAVAGVMGGYDSEVGEGTTALFLESAYFNPVSVRRTARALGLQTEASQRFQRGADPEMAVYAMNRMAALIHETSGGAVAQGLLDAHPNPLPKRQVRLRYSRTKLLLGAPVEPDQQQRILAGLGCPIEAKDEESFTVQIPTWRHDIKEEADLIEEVARHYGYDRIEATLPKVRPSHRVFAPEERRTAELRNLLVSQGLTEIMTMAFASPEEAEAAGLGQPPMVFLQNPLSEQSRAMRTSLVPALLNTASKNIRHGNANLALFEIAPVYIPADGEDLPREETHLGLLLTGLRGVRHWSAQPQPVDFYDLKGYAEEILLYFGASPAFTHGAFGPLQSGVCARLEADGAALGYLGEVNRAVRKRFDIEAPVYLLTLNLEPLLRIPGPKRASSPSRLIHPPCVTWRLWWTRTSPLAISAKPHGKRGEAPPYRRVV